jgi:large subunit ribosomal protein L10
LGRNRENKAAVIADLKESLSDAQLAVVIDFQGLTVAEITDLRNRLRPAGAICKVSKNTFMEKAINGDENWSAMSNLLAGPSAFVVVNDNLSGAVKAYKEFQKATKKTELRGGVMDGRALSKAEVEAIGDLPSKEQLYAQIAGAINALATKIAVGVKEVPSGLARGIKAVSEKES